MISRIHLLIATLCALAASSGCAQDPSGSGADGGASGASVLANDAGTYATPRTPNAVSCATEGGHACALPTPVCCGTAKFQPVDSGRPADSGFTTAEAEFIGYDVICASDVASCAGELNQACDGPDDCPTGESCCLTEGGSWYFKTLCAPMCSPLGNEGPGVLAQLCHDHTDCPADFSACCAVRMPDASAPFGFCVSLGKIQAGGSAVCDVP